MTAKSTIVFDIKPADSEVTVNDIETAVRSIAMDGLVWGSSQSLPIGFGLHKLQICCVVEDEKVSTDILEESITNLEELVQSVDIVSFNKV